jgi:hypothetical protein
LNLISLHTIEGPFVDGYIYVNAWLWCIGTASINIWGITELMLPWAHSLNEKIVALCLEFSSLCRFFYYTYLEYLL